MSGAPKTEDFEADVDYVDQDEDDDEEEEGDEDDFVPGAEDEDDDGEGEEDIVPLLDGFLYLDDSQSLHYQGDGFHFSSNEPPKWNVIDPHACRSAVMGDTFDLIMTGSCDFESAQETKATPRKMKVTFEVVSSAEIDPLLREMASQRRRKSSPLSTPSQQQTTTTTTSATTGNNDGDNDEPESNRKVKASPKKGNNDNNDDEDETSNNQKLTALVHRVFGHQIDTHGGDAMEFVGVYFPPKTVQEQVSLTCQVRTIPAAAPSAATAAVAVRAAVASPNSARIDNEDDDDDEDEEYEEEVDYNELIALHEDAGMSVDALQKRYRGSGADGGGADDIDEGRSKRSKKPPPRSSSGEDDDDDDYGF